MVAALVLASAASACDGKLGPSIEHADASATACPALTASPYDCEAGVLDAGSCARWGDTWDDSAPDASFAIGCTLNVPPRESNGECVRAPNCVCTRGGDAAIWFCEK